MQSLRTSRSCFRRFMQSPIQLDNRYAKPICAKDGMLEAHYARSTAATILNEGDHPYRQLKVEFPANAGMLLVDSKPYRLQNFHIHISAEHELNGIKYPMESHIVHEDPAGNIAVVGILYRVSAEKDPFIYQVEHHLPSLVLRDGRKEIDIDASLLKVPECSFFRYSGSLTIPPFTEKVIWNVIKETRTISLSQYQLLRAALKGVNAREIQPLNDRTVHYCEC